MKFLSRYFTNLHPLQRKEKRCEGPRWVGPAVEEALCPCCSPSFPSPATLLLMNTSNMEGQAFSKPSQGQFSASWWGETGCEYSLFMASQVLKEWWRKRQEGLVYQRYMEFAFLRECYRYEVLLTPLAYAQSALV